jgi:hypothetical protein
VKPYKILASVSFSGRSVALPSSVLLKNGEMVLPCKIKSRFHFSNSRFIVIFAST